MAAQVPTGTALYVGFRGAKALPVPRSGGEANDPAERDSPVCRVCINKQAPGTGSLGEQRRAGRSRQDSSQ